jgi:hypothetical protein
MGDFQSQRNLSLEKEDCGVDRPSQGKRFPITTKSFRVHRVSEPPHIPQDQDKMEIAYRYIDLANSLTK